MTIRNIAKIILVIALVYIAAKIVEYILGIIGLAVLSAYGLAYTAVPIAIIFFILYMIFKRKKK